MPRPTLTCTTLTCTTLTRATLPRPRVRAALVAATTLTAALAVASGPAAGDIVYGLPDYKLAVWNHDLELGSNGATPSHWHTIYSPAASSSLKAVRATATSPFPLRTSDNAYNHVLQVYDASASGGVQTYTDAVQAVAGRTYAADMQVYVKSGTGSSISLEFLNSSGARVGSLVPQANKVPTAGTLTYVRSLGKAPTGATAVRARIISSYGATGTSYWETLFITQATPGESVPPTLGTGAVLFVGGQRVQSSPGLTRVVISGRKSTKNTDGIAGPDPVYDANYLADPERPTGTTGLPQHSSQMFGTVLKEGATYRLWFTGKNQCTFANNCSGQASADQNWSTYYTSTTDPNHFPRAKQVLNNVWVGGVVLNPSTSDPSKKYLMLGTRGTLVASSTGAAPDVTYRAYASADGVTWSNLNGGLPVLPWRDIAYVSYDTKTHRFLATSKQASGTSDRQVYTATSADFIHWTAPVQAMRADASDAGGVASSANPSGSSVYGFSAFRYGEQLLGIPLMYRYNYAFAGGKGPVVPQIASSSDGVHWDRNVPRTPLIYPGAAGQLDDGFLLTGNDLTQISADTYRMYYAAWDGGHEAVAGAPTRTTRTTRLFYADWTRDRFVAMRAGGSAGTLTTKTFTPTGSNLYVNAKLNSGGSVKVEVLDSAGNPIAGYSGLSAATVSGDHLDNLVTWGVGQTIGDIGTSMKLRFTVTNGDLYSFRVS